MPEHFPIQVNLENCTDSIPFPMTIERMQMLVHLECPLMKLDVIFRIFIGIMAEELEQYFKGPKRDLIVESSDLRWLMVYILVQTRQPKLSIDIDLVQEFMPNVLKYTNRAFYISMLQSAYEYIDTLTDKDVEELFEKINLTNSMKQTNPKKAHSSNSLKFYVNIDEDSKLNLAPKLGKLVDTILDMDSRRKNHLRMMSSDLDQQ